MKLFICFLPALYRSSFTSKTPNKDQQVEQPFYCPFVQVLDVHELCSDSFCVCYPQVLTKSTSCKKWYVLVSLDRFPFCSSCPALQYEPETKFFIQVLPEIRGIKNRQNFSTTAWCLYVILLSVQATIYKTKMLSKRVFSVSLQVSRMAALS